MMNASNDRYALLLALATSLALLCGVGGQPATNATAASNTTSPAAGGAGPAAGAAGPLFLAINADTPTGPVPISMLNTPLLGSIAGQYWGTVPATSINTVCQAITKGQANPTITAAVTAYGKTANYTVKVDSSTGCSTTTNAPAGVQALLIPVSSANTAGFTANGRKFAIICGNYNNMTWALLPTPVTSCNVYVEGSDVTSYYQMGLTQPGSNLTAAAPAAGRRHARSLKQQQNRQPGAITTSCNQNGCRMACICPVTITNVQDNCFPGNAEVVVQHQGLTRMDSLKVGDKVLVSNGKNAPLYDEVYFFGHQKPSEKAATFVLEMRTAADKSATLELTPEHFLPIITSSSSFKHKYAKDVQVGDRLMIVDNGNLVEAEVVIKSMAVGVGMFNPYTKSGYIVVNNVVASAHSEWVLDQIMPASLSHLLPHIYQISFMPLRVLYDIFGANAMDYGSSLVIRYGEAYPEATKAIIGSALVGTMLASFTSVKGSRKFF